MDSPPLSCRWPNRHCQGAVHWSKLLLLEGGAPRKETRRNATLDQDFIPSATKYFSLIALGLSVVIGYVIWRVVHRGASDAGDTSGEKWLEEELERIRTGAPEKAAESPPGGEPDGSGLGGPAYTAEQVQLLRRAQEAERLRREVESEHQ